MTENKQQADNIMNTAKPIDTLKLYHSDISLAHYLIFDLFRVLRPIRVKYRLTINEIVFLIGAKVYHCVIGSTFSYSGLRLYIKYYNDNKFKYYLNSLLKKGCIIQSDVFNGSARYKLTEYGILVLNELDDSYDSSINRFISENNIVL